jgi:hypothetical protein
VLAMQRMAGNRAVGRLLARRRLLARYQIEGPLNMNDPVHEVLSLVAIRKAMDILGKTPTGLLGVDISKFPALSSTDGHNIDARSIDKSAQQFVRGVMWPDDPKGWLFDDDSGTENYSSGLKWYVERPFPTTRSSSSSCTRRAARWTPASARPARCCI